jgi:hypothetical protein
MSSVIETQKSSRLTASSRESSNRESSEAIKAVNNVIVTVEKTGAVGKRQETFITQKGGKM